MYIHINIYIYVYISLTISVITLPAASAKTQLGRQTRVQENLPAIVRAVVYADARTIAQGKS
jgi:hypothetical protein